MDILVHSFVIPNLQYRLNTVEKTLIPCDLPVKDGYSSGEQGIGCCLTLGLFRRSAKGFALYIDKNEIFFYADGECLNLETDIQSAQRIYYPFFRKFIITTKSRKLSWTYWPIDWIEDEPYIRDFFWYVEWVVGSSSKRASFKAFWSEVKQGKL